MPTGRTIALCDLSGSMNHPIDLTGETSRDLLQRALVGIRTKRPEILVYAFSDTCERVYEVSQLPRMGDGTALTEALTTVRSERPDTLIVITDGMPDHPQSALTAAMMLNCKIETIYCGPERNPQAIKFLRDLAACSGKGSIGHSQTLSLAKPEEFAEEVLKLSGPAAR